MAFNWFKKKKETETPETPEESDAPSPPSAPEDAEAPPLEAPEPVSDDGADAPEMADADVEPAEKKSGGFFGRLKSGLSKTREILTTDIDDLFSGGRALDDELLEELEELLITSDVGVRTTTELLERIGKRRSKINTARAFKEALKEEILAIIEPPEPRADPVVDGPRVVMVVGVNGVGKTTTIGKLAARAVQQGNKVLIGAADTFRAAAIEQLDIWARRAGADIVRHKDNADPAAVAYDSVEAAMARRADLVFIDTAGRLHTKVNLMEELKKIRRTVGKVIPEAPHEILLVLDATTGQNALSQAEMFNEAMGVTGIALTKLDGTARGGIAVAICGGLGLPLQFIGVGESVEDLQEFDPVQYVEALF